MKKWICRILALTIIVSTMPKVGVFADNIEGWNIQLSGGVEATAKVEKDEKTGAGCMVFTNQSPVGPNKFMLVTTDVQVEEGKTYVYGFRGKAQDIRRCYVMINWGTRNELYPFTGTYDWTNYEFLYSHTGATGSVTLQFLVEDITKKLSIDDVTFYEYGGDGKVGENKIQNSKFDSNATVQVETGGTTEEKRVENIKNSATFTENNFAELYGGFKYAPVYKAKSLKVDGDISEWTNYPKTKLPTLKEQFQVYTDSKFDVCGTFQYAYDKDNFYLAIEVEDDKHIGLNNGDYWKSDSIQICLGEYGESYGLEMGFVIGNDGSSGVYSSGLTTKQLDSVQLKTAKTDKKLTYEVAIPWSLKYKEMPTEIYFNGLINVDDGKGRAYCVQLAKGISEGKYNSEFPRLKMMDTAKEYDGWIEGVPGLIQNQEGNFDFYFVNNGNGKNVTFNIPSINDKSEITLAKGQGIHKKIRAKFPKTGKNQLLVYVTIDGKQETVAFDVNVTLSLDTFDDKYFEDLNNKEAELGKLLEQCDEKGIATDYEMVNYTIYKRFIEYFKNDIEHKDYTRLEYTSKCLDTLYTQAKADLTSYLSGEKKSEFVPRYVTDDVKISGRSMNATTVAGEKEEIRPVFFNGYGHFGQVRKDIPNFQNFGVNIIQNEIGPSAIIKKKGSITTWSLQLSNGFKADAMLDSENVKDGKYSAKVVCDAQVGANQFLALRQNIAVKPNTTYYFGLSAKAENVGSMWFSARGFDDRKALTGTYDWKDFTYSYKTEPNQTSLEFIICCDEKVGSMNVDNVYLKEGKNGENLVENGDFEDSVPGDGNFDLDLSGIEDIQDMLQDAEDNNIAVSLLISPHYFPEFLYEQYPDLRMDGFGFIHFNINHPVVREVMSLYIKTLIPAIADYKSLNNICLTNEPAFFSTYSDYVLPDWYKYLNDFYKGDINALNKVYGTNHSTFEEVDMPRDPKTKAPLNDGSPKMYDWLCFNNELFAEFHEFLVAEVKKYAPNVPLTAKQMTHIFNQDWGSYRESILHGTDFEKFADFTDIMGNDAWQCLDQNVTATRTHEKTMWYDMQRSYAEKPIYNSEDHIIYDGDSAYIPEHAIRIYTDLWQGAIHGRTASTMWVWEKTYSNEGDWRGNILNRPDCIQKVGKVNLDLNRLAYEVTAFQNAKSDVGLVYSNASRSYSLANMANQYNAYESLVYNGQNAEIITESVIKKIHDYKLIVLPELTNVYKETLDEINKYIKNGGKVIIMGENSLKNDTQNFPHNSEVVKYIYENSTVIATENGGYTLVSPKPEQLVEKFATVIKDCGLNKVEIVDAKTGKPVDKVEWQTIVYKGKTLINICNFKFYNPLEITVKVNSKECTKSKDLISGEVYGKTIKLDSFSPIMLEL